MEQQASSHISEINRRIEALQSEFDRSIANGNTFMESKVILSELKYWKKLLDTHHQSSGNSMSQAS